MRMVWRLEGLFACLILLCVGCIRDSSPDSASPDLASPTPSQDAEDASTDSPADSPTPQQLKAIKTIEEAGGAISYGEDSLPVTIDLASDRVFANEPAVRSVLQFPELRCLRLAVSNVTPECLAELSSLGQLTELFLQDAPIGDGELAALAAGMPLERLTLRRLNNVSDEGIGALVAECDLKVLALIEMNQVSGQSLGHLRRLGRLRSLDLRNCGGMAEEDFGKLLELKELRELKLAGPAITDAVLGAVLKLPALSALTIEDAEVTSDGLKQLTADPELAGRLRSLSIARCFNVMDESLEMLAELPVLESLALRDVMVGGAFINSLVESTEQPLALKMLVMNDTFLGDEALAELPKLAPSLERLDLRRNTGVTDASVPSIRQLRRLKQVYLEGTGISEAEAEQLMADVASGRLQSQESKGTTDE